MENSYNIIKIIKDNSSIKLSYDFQTKLVNKIRDSFTDDQQRLFVASFYSYLNYNSKTDFVINLDDIWKWCGFARKDNAKKVIEKNFTKDTEYKIVFRKLAENLQVSEEKAAPQVGGAGSSTRNLGGAGLNKETILMTIETFKSLCMLAGTSKSKEIRQYYLKLEDLMQDTLNEESEELKKELIKVKREKFLMKNRRWADVEPCETIYVYKDNIKDVDSLIKIGKTKDISQREKDYSSFSKSGGIIYYKEVLNCSLAEKMCHHILDKYRVDRNQEWFNTNEQLAKDTVDIVSTLININNNSNEFIVNLKNYFVENNLIKSNLIDNTLEENNSIKNVLQKNSIENNIQNEHDINIEPAEFIKQQCELGNDKYCFVDEIRMAYRIWSKQTNKKLTDNLIEYMKTTFPTGIEVVEDIRKKVYRGLSLKPLTWEPQYDKLYETFISENCDIGYSNRISYSDFYIYFEKWMIQTDTNFKLDIKYKKEIQQYLETKFAGGRVHLSNTQNATHLHGVWGISLKGNDGLKTKKLTRKGVSEFSISTGEKIRSWDSLSIASSATNIPKSTLSNYMRFNRHVGNVYYKYDI